MITLTLTLTLTLALTLTLTLTLTLCYPGHPGEPSPNHSAYFMCKHFREQCDALTPAQRKDAGLPS